MSYPNRSKAYPTDKYKRFYYPTRPLFTVMLGLSLLSLGLIGLLPISWALWLSAAFAFDDLPLTPIMAFVTSVNNLINGRKQTKALIMITSIILASIAGGLLGYFVLSQSAAFMAYTTAFIEATTCSPIFISIGAIIGGLFAHLSKKCGSFIGIALGVLIASLIPPTIVPLMVDVVFMSAAAGAFITSIAVKQSLRAYYKFRYGDSNADGYNINRGQVDQTAFIDVQANKFGVTPAEFLKLTQYCKDNINDIKANASFFEEFAGNRTLASNSYKDIYHGLMNSNATREDIDATKHLIMESSEVSITLAQGGLTSDPNEIRLLTTTSELAKPKRRLLYHQLWLVKDEKGKGIPEDTIIPFLGLTK